ncbi:MAG: metallophosphoesterase family protein [Deltaproteobacteria bacterium]|nr:metallophosphoesterase family protein [Deltaproteobacteria bacterium]
MRYAIISDIHANLEAFEVTLQKIDELEVEMVVCLGDLVGYNVNPKEIIKLMHEEEIDCIMGNHDAAVSGIEPLSQFNQAAKDALIWTQKILDDEEINYLKKLPRELIIDNTFFIVHGSIKDPNRYISSEIEAMEDFLLLEKNTNLPHICFFGHTHQMGTFIYSPKNKNVISSHEEHFFLSPENYYLINPGSIGQPRDGDPRASFLIYDSDSQEITFYREKYDVDSAANKVIEYGLNKTLAERLYLGW